MAESATTRPDTEGDVIKMGNLELNVANYRVNVGGRAVDLTYHEFDLLSLLAAQPDRIVAFRDLTQALWSSQGYKELRRLNVLAFRLRAKLRESQPYRLETVRGRGYGLVKSVVGGVGDA
ncbi:MAG TPA: winged helix-turn-helix domain-containing protein [Dehalococcoidia bacterium]|jgi:DNA-binding response OmpR family regulator